MTPINTLKTCITSILYVFVVQSIQFGMRTVHHDEVIMAARCKLDCFSQAGASKVLFFYWNSGKRIYCTIEVEHGKSDSRAF